MTRRPSIDVEGFIEDGFTVLRGAVPRTVAAAVLAVLESTAEPSHGEAWRIEQRSIYDMPILVEAVTEAVRACFDALAGTGGWHLAANWGFPWRCPGPIEAMWHIDGDWFTHHVWSGEQMLTPIFLWHDVDQDGGPTLLARGTHREVARLLASREPEGVPGDRIGRAVHEAINVVDAVPATGTAGDVYVCHPFLGHSFSPIGPAEPRVISNVCVHGRSTIDLHNPLTPVARAVANALIESDTAVKPTDENRRM